MKSWRRLVTACLVLLSISSSTEQSCSQGSVRLQGGNSTRGRVEICNNNEWGTVCDDEWDANDARVVCQQLGLPSSGATVVPSSIVPDGTGSIFLDDVQCTGTESQLIDCPARPLGSHNCAHREDAGVSCQAAVTSNCTQGSVRLQGGNSMQGRVEICNNNEWGTVCDDSWDLNDAKVVCRQLGHSTTGATALSSSDVPDGTGLILLDDVQCTGTESRLVDCLARPLGSHNCAHSEDAGARCQAAATTQDLMCTQGSVRLQGGNSTQGRVEICNNNEWGTVCDDFWGVNDARVVCQQLGLPSSGATALTLDDVPDGTGPIFLDNVQCTGTESRLVDCPARPLGSHDCAHNEDAGVSCQVAQMCTQGSVRLQGGNSTQGRVEICNNNQWGTVCDDLWDANDAQVVCRQLGLSTTRATALTLNNVPNGIGPIFLDDVQCTGNESRLVDCPARPLESHNCGHSEDAGVSCQFVPGAPTNLAVFYVTGLCTNVLLQWDPPAFNQQHGILQDYRVTVVNQETGSVNVLLSASISISVPGLMCCTGYNFTVEASTIEFGPRSNTEIFTTQPDIFAIQLTVRLQSNSARIDVLLPSNSTYYFDVSYFNYTGDKDADLKATPVNTIRTNRTEVVISNLNACQAYWIITSAVRCKDQVNSDASIIDLYKPQDYVTGIDLNNEGPCKQWIIASTNLKMDDAKNFFMDTLNNVCSTSLCVANVSFSCEANNENMVFVRTTLVSNNGESSSDEKKCLDDWIAAGGADGKDISIGGKTLKIVSSAGGTQGPSIFRQIPSWVWAIAAIIAVGLVLSLLIAILIFVNLRKSKKRFDDHDTVHSVGVLDNPLFSGDQEIDEKNFQQLEGEMSFNEDGTKDTEVQFSANVDPPNNDYF